MNGDHGGGRFAVLTYSQANGLGGLTSYIQEWSRTGDKKLAPSTVRVILTRACRTSSNAEIFSPRPDCETMDRMLRKHTLAAWHGSRTHQCATRSLVTLCQNFENPFALERFYVIWKLSGTMVVNERAVYDVEKSRAFREP